jgi:hypothetical protein
MKRALLLFILPLLIGLGGGLAYSWLISPIEYVDAHPSLLRSDFKEQYRIVIAASYAATQDLPRARARLELLGDPDPTAELSAQAQRMVATGESIENVQPLVRLATDLKQGFASAPPTPTPFPIFNTPQVDATPTFEEFATTVEEGEEDLPTETPLPTAAFEQTPLVPVTAETPTPRPTFTSTAGAGAPFVLVDQETVCDPAARQSVLQFTLTDSRGRPAAGVEIIVTWERGEDRFFTGFKSELGNGYADFTMQADTVYNIRIVTGGSFIPNITAPVCTDTNGTTYPGSLRLNFKQ